MSDSPLHNCWVSMSMNAGQHAAHLQRGQRGAPVFGELYRFWWKSSADREVLVWQ